MDCDAYNILIFDCDGVLIDANNLKLEAAERILEGFPKSAVARFIAHFKKSFGRSRYDLFREFIENFLEKPFDQELYDKLIEAYGEKCSELYQKSPVIEGVEAFLAKHQDKYLYVASGGIDSELKSVLSSRGMGHYFSKICGSPPSKKENVANILKSHPGARALMVGDAHTDFEAAQASGIDFLFCSQYTTDASGMDALQKEYGFDSVENLGRLLG